MESSKVISVENGNIIKKEKDVSIQVIRIVSMILIIFAHIASESSSGIIKNSAQFLNVGVWIFLFISGYLYGRKEKIEIKRFYIGRLKKVFLPMYLFMICLYIITYIVKGNIDIKYAVIYLFDLQYIFGGMNGATHLWFLTSIGICYLITPFLAKYKEKMLKHKLIIIIAVILIGIALGFVSEIASLCVLYFSIYLIGYLNSNKEKINMFLCLAMVALGIGLRLIGRKLLDGTVYYNIFIVFFTQTMLAISIFYIVKAICEKLNLKQSKLINYFDEYSYYIYITHYMFFRGPIITMNLIDSFILNIVITLILSYISSAALKLFCNGILSLLDKITKKVISNKKT